MQLGPRAAVVGVSAVSAFGFGWRGLGQTLLGRALAPRPCEALSRSHPGTHASEVPPVPPTDEVSDVKTRRLMSRAAHLAAVAMKKALADSGWDQGRDEIGCFLGLGASGGPMEELLAILKASIVGAKVDPARFCREGLASAHPLLAFHLLSNYILCHGSIAAGVGGPNRAFYSRGTGTVTAIAEACWALAEGDCSRTLAGGADSALHLATFEELHLEGYTARGFVPGEGAALLALAVQSDRALAWIEGCAVDRELGALLEKLGGAHCDVAILVPWGPPARESLIRAVHPVHPGDLSLSLADPLAAGPALACAAATDLLTAGAAADVLVLCAGIDGAFGGIRLSRGRLP
ncbi:MAG TPA: beta-ketoacyl synthase N-terminal-like domain-containing protein [Myxococcales bacterium]|jgi:hypothetical protein